MSIQCGLHISWNLPSQDIHLSSVWWRYRSLWPCTTWYTCRCMHIRIRNAFHIWKMVSIFTFIHSYKSCCYNAIFSRQHYDLCNRCVRMRIRNTFNIEVLLSLFSRLYKVSSVTRNAWKWHPQRGSNDTLKCQVTLKCHSHLSPTNV